MSQPLAPELEALLIFTRERFPKLAQVPCDVEAIVKGGSDRRFFRLRWQSEQHPDMVLMFYTHERSDNAKFVPATHRLAKRGVNVPHLFDHDEERLAVWMEDLGALDLHSLRNHDWDTRRAGYEWTLDQAAKIHSATSDTLSKGDLLTLEPQFDEQLYLWEQNYFLDHYVGAHRGKAITVDAQPEAHEALRKLRRGLDKEPRNLVHRDFQSQNVILRENSAWLVDYQGLRLGLAEYDLASLLYDPYVTFTDEQREELLIYYAVTTGRTLLDIERNFYRCAAQRLMQALGAYGNLSRNLNKPAFAQHIPAAERNLRSVISKDVGLTPLLAFLD
jgi:N-acetylmuramate 1-kinase